MAMIDLTADVVDLTRQSSGSPRASTTIEEDARLGIAARLLLEALPCLKPGKARRLCRKELGDSGLAAAGVFERARAAAVAEGFGVSGAEATEAEDTLECGCCFCETSLSELAQCSEGHVFCRECLASYAREQVFGGGRAELGCMCTDEPRCLGSFAASQLRAALPPSEFAKLEETAAVEAARTADVALHTCPKCGVPHEAGGRRVAVCPQPGCGFESCVDCRGPAHGDGPCGGKRARPGGGGGGDEADAKRLRVEEALTEAKVRTCPKCGAKFFKSDGCNKMTCACGEHTCYVCRAHIPKHVGYQHFCTTPHCDHASCGKCRLYTDDAEDEKTALADAARRAGDRAGKG